MKLIKKYFFAFLLVFSILIILSSAFIIEDTNYKIKGIISTGGSVNMTSITGNFISKIVVGQPVIGIVSGGNYKLCFGALCSGMFEPQYNMNFTGYILYSNGSAVADTDITFKIKYKTSEFIKSSTTNTSGYFFITENIPEYVTEKDLSVTIEIENEDVKAVYECAYNHLTTNCTTV